MKITGCGQFCGLSWSMKCKILTEQNTAAIEIVAFSFARLLLPQDDLLLQNFAFTSSTYILNIFPIQAHPVSLFVYLLFW